MTLTGAVDLSRSAALVTGGADGIGGATVRALRDRGCQVTIADIDSDRGEALAAEVGALFVSCDVTDPASVDAAVAFAESSYGRLDLVHLNAGVTTGSPTVEVSDDDYRRLLAVNVDGVFFGLRAALPALRRAGGGVVVATASVGGLAPIPVDPLYGRAGVGCREHPPGRHLPGLHRHAARRRPARCGPGPRFSAHDRRNDRRRSGASGRRGTAGRVLVRAGRA